MSLQDYPLVIREAHVDSLGHMNNATYLALFEEARWENITRAGYGFSEIQKHRKGPVILEVTLKFLRELHLRESITIRSEVIGSSGKISRMKQQMIKPDGTIAAEAIFTFGLFDLETRRLIEPTPEWKKAIGLES